MQKTMSNGIRVNGTSDGGSKSSRGVTMLETAFAIPVILLIFAVTYDLARVYTATILCQDVALMAAKVSKAADPTVDTPSTSNLIKSAPGENGSITTARSNFWSRQISILSTEAPGKTAYTEKELKSLNLAYGYLNSLNNNVAFPIPYKDPLTFEDLGGVTNCSIYFNYDNTAWASQSDTTSTHRIFTAKCSVPLWALRFFGQSVAPSGFLTVSRTAYAYESGAAL